MGWKKWVWFGCNTVFAILMFVLAAINGPIIHDLVQGQANDQMILSEKKSDTWAYVPGHSKVRISRQFYFFNLTNPDAVKWEGAKPTLYQTPGYRYQEYTSFIERYYIHAGGEDDGWVKFRRLMYYEKWDDWEDGEDGLSEQDKITSLNLGAFNAWDQMKRLPNERLGPVVISTLVGGLDDALWAGAYAQGLLALFGEFDTAYIIIFQPSGFTKEEAQVIWDDPKYGWSDWGPFINWVLAYWQGLSGEKMNEFNYPYGQGGACFILETYFGLTSAQINSLFTGTFGSFFDIIGISLVNAYDCDPNKHHCDHHYLVTLQWSSQGLTKYPPSPAVAPQDSAAALNSTILGYPEITYFQDNYYSETDARRNLKWDLDLAQALLDYDIQNGQPSGSDYTLLDTGHLTNLFMFGEEGDFNGIQTQFNLPSINHAEVLFDYFNALIDITALHGNTDRTIYNKDNRGLTQELSMGNLLSQANQEVIPNLGTLLAVDVTSKYAYGYIVLENKHTCTEVLTGMGIPTKQACLGPLDWTSPVAMQLWIVARWDGPGSNTYLTLQTYSQLSNDDMTKLYADDGTLSQLLSTVDSNLKTHYQCSSPGKRCFDFELGVRQWGGSLITNNIPNELKIQNFQNTLSVYNWGAPYTVFPGPPEYSAYAIPRGKQPLDYATADSLMTYTGFLSQVVLQDYFIQVFWEDWVGIESKYGIPDAQTMTDYFRYIADEFALGGLFTTQTVGEWLWTGTSKLLETLAATSPLKGGDPSLDVTQVQLGRNNTAVRLGYPDHFKHAYWTGQKKIETHLRDWTLFWGHPNITNLVRKYKGHNQDGPIIEYESVLPWAENIPLKGTDGFGFQTNVNSDSDIYVYLDDFLRHGPGYYDKVVHHHGLKCYRYRLSGDIVANQQTNPDNAKYYCGGPNGIANVTPIFEGPMWVSKPYYYNGDESLLKVLDIRTGYSDDLEDYDSIFDLEHFTGTIMNVQEQIMTMGELRPDILYPKLASQGLIEQGINTYMPIFYLNRSAHWSQDRVDLIFGDIKTSMLVIDILTVVGYSLGGVFTAISCLFLAKVGYTYYKKRKHGTTDNDTEMDLAPNDSTYPLNPRDQQPI